jgi:hypothetical protein
MPRRRVVELSDMAGFARKCGRPQIGAPQRLRLDLATNVAAIGFALKNDETSPEAAALISLRASGLASGRDADVPQLRGGSDDAGRGRQAFVRRALRCSRWATIWRGSQAGYLHGWITAGL